ncbi:unannotated protein [freshwater metagenome]|uniref:Unannotated protein n=1 Tax=freshwater metagenome TaxID=449393 RepID=A0A6J6SLF0_9ZZZZ
MRGFERRKTDPPVALAHVKLRALAGGVAQRGERRTRGIAKGVGRRGRTAERDGARTQAEPAVLVAAQHAVHLEGNGQPVRSWTGDAGGRDEAG